MNSSRGPSRNESRRGGPSMQRRASQKSLRKGLARGSLALVENPSFRGEPVALTVPVTNGAGGQLTGVRAPLRLTRIHPVA